MSKRRISFVNFVCSSQTPSGPQITTAAYSRCCITTHLAQPAALEKFARTVELHCVEVRPCLCAAAATAVVAAPPYLHLFSFWPTVGCFCMALIGQMQDASACVTLEKVLEDTSDDCMVRHEVRNTLPLMPVLNFPFCMSYLLDHGPHM